MRFTAAFVLASAAIAAAQSSTTSSAAAASQSYSASGCSHAIDLIIQACLQDTTPQLNACAANDWHCLCQNVKVVLTCYNSCTSAPAAYTLNEQKQSWCEAAAAYPSSTSKNSAGTAVATMASSMTTTKQGAHTGFASASGSAPSSSSSGVAAAAYTPAAGVVAALFGLALL